MSAAGEPVTAKGKPDWERIQAGYRAGVLSLREIASREGVSHVAIAKRAKKEGWPRDLAAKINAKADALVNEAVTASVNTVSTVTERAVVEASAEAIAAVRLSHRKDISRARRLCLALTDELELLTGEREQLSEIVDAIDAQTVDPKALERLRAALDKAISLPVRAGTLKSLTDSLRSLVTLEREAWGLDKGAGQGGHTYDDLLAELHGEAPSGGS